MHPVTAHPQTTQYEVGLLLRFEGLSITGELRVGDDDEPRPFGSWLGLLSLLEALEPIAAPLTSDAA